MATFHSADLKLNRAEDHLRALDEEIGAYLESEPYKLVLNVQPSDQRLVLIEFHVVQQPPERFSTILGDCVHNLRSSLDHAICDLVRKAGGDCEKTQFPIPKKAPKAPPGVGGPIDAKALALIDAAQPYHRGQDAPSHPLAVLRDLSNIDKHRTLHTMAAYLKESSAYLHYPPSGALLGGQFIEGSVASDQAPLAAFRFPKPFSPVEYPNVEVHGGGTAFVAIQESGPWAERPATIVLEEILQFIRDDLLPTLTPFL